MTATALALALAGAAVALNGQASSDAAVGATVGSVIAPDTATIEIVSTGVFAWKFSPAHTALAVGGTLTVHNATGITHTFTSNAKTPDGRPYFSVKLESGATKTVTAVSALHDGDLSILLPNPPCDDRHPDRWRRRSSPERHDL